MIEECVPKKTSRIRSMADEVFVELNAMENGWNENDIDRVQSDLLPRIYDLLNLLAMAEHFGVE